MHDLITVSFAAIIGTEMLDKISRAESLSSAYGQWDILKNIILIYSRHLG